MTAPFYDTPLDAAVKIPRWLAALVLAAVAAGALVGYTTAAAPPARLVRAIFLGAAFAYLSTSLVDFREHFLLERALGGRWLAWRAVPLGETLNHLMTSATLGGIFLLARPLPPALQARDWFVLAAPAIFLALGWRDEIVYHRRRAAHREDIMHTVSHLAGGIMLTAFYLLRLALRA